MGEVQEIKTFSIFTIYRSAHLVNIDFRVSKE